MAKKILWILVLLAVLVLGVLAYFKFYFKFGEGVKAGELNQFVYKGWIWKTYEGRLIQAGIRGSKNGPGIQSNEFNFSVVDEQVAGQLMRCSGKMVELHYTEYNGMLPWRGMQRYVVDKVLSVSESDQPLTTVPIFTEE